MKTGRVVGIYRQDFMKYLRKNGGGRTRAYMPPVAAVLLCLTAACTASRVSPECVGMSSERLGRVDSVCRSWIDNGDLPHAAAVIVRHGEIVFDEAYGWRSMEDSIPLRKDDIFRLASCSKAVTSVALMTLFEQGKFFLDDPISEFIPEFKNPVVLDEMSPDGLTYTSHPAAREITFRDLLTHRSGIAYATLWGHPTYRLCKEAGIPNITSTDSITIGEAVKRYAEIPLEAEPGERWIYGWNLDVAGYLIEILSGKPFDVYLRETIFEPLGMNDTYFFLPDDKADRLVTLYSKAGKDSPCVRCSNEFYQSYPVTGAKTYFSGGGGLCGTIGDYARFCMMMLNGGELDGHRILGRRTVELMTTDQTGADEDNSGWSLAFNITGKGDERRLLASAGSYSWSGMFNTFYMCDPKEDMAVLLFWNGNNFYDPGLFGKFKLMTYQALID